MFIHLCLSVIVREKYQVNQSEYDTAMITDAIRQLAPHYLIKKPKEEFYTLKLGKENITVQYHANMSNYFARFRKQQNQSNYTHDYIYAAYHYIQGVRLLFGINEKRDQLKALSHLQASSRYGCNEATSLIAQSHKNGNFGLSQSPALAFNYYKELFLGWAAGISQVNSYQYNYNRHYVDLMLGVEAKEANLPKSERQHIIIDAMENTQNRALYGNIIASGLLTNTFGFLKDEDMSARFAYMSALGDFKVTLDDGINSLENVIKFEEQEQQQNINRGIEKIVEKQKDPKEKQKNKFQKILSKVKSIINGQPSEDEEDININQYKNYAVPANLRSKLEKYKDKYTIEGINLFQFNKTIPLTEDALYQAMLKLGREVTWQIYQDYGYMKIFKNFTKNNATKDAIFDFVMYSNSTWINQAVRMFVDKTDSDPNLELLRNMNGFIDGGYDVYYDAVKQQPQVYRAWKETCSRRGQAFGLLAYFINSDVMCPKVVKDSRMNRNIGRIMNLGAAFYGCHMGLTGLSFLALEGYRPYVNDRLNQVTLTPKEPNDTEARNCVYVRPEPRQALMSLDVASQAGSFESSYFEALLLSHKVYEYSPKLKEHSQFYFNSNFEDIGYQNVEQMPNLAKMLAEHSAHAGHLGGQFLSGVFAYEGYGSFAKSAVVGLERMKRAAQRLTTDWVIEEDTEEETSIVKQFAQYMVHTLSGDDVSLTNLFRLRKQVEKHFNGTVCMSNRNGQEKCMQGSAGMDALLIELGAILGNEQPGVITELSKLCQANSEVCQLAINGFDEYADKKTQRKYLQHIRNDLTVYGQLNKFLNLLVSQFNNEFIESWKTKIIKHFKQEKKADKIRYESPAALIAAIKSHEVPTSNEILVDKLLQNSKQSKFASLLYNCFYNDSFEYSAYRTLYPQCLLIKNILIHLSGQNFKKYFDLSTRTDPLGDDTKHFLQENQKNLNGLILQLIFTYPDLYLINLFNLQNNMNVKLCNETKFDFVKKPYFQLADIHEYLQKNKEYDLSEIHEALDLMNNEHARSQIQSDLNGNQDYGFFSPEVSNFKEVFDFCQLKQKKGTIALKIILQVYLVLQCHIEFLLAGLFLIVGLYLWDKIAKYKLAHWVEKEEDEEQNQGDGDEKEKGERQEQAENEEKINKEQAANAQEVQIQNSEKPDAEQQSMGGNEIHVGEKEDGGKNQ